VEAEVQSKMSKRKVTVIDYGMGNIWSVISALNYLNVEVKVSDSPKEILESETLLLPGVGSFRKAMDTLQRLRLDQAIIDSVLEKQHKILGICLGMQLLGSASTEDGETRGLNLFSSPVDKFSEEGLGTLKVPHTGFNQVEADPDSKLFRGIESNSDFYFVHSYRMLPENLSGIKAECEYGERFLAAYERDNIYATQFHPEKSQTNGLILLQNFMEI
jgi:glutamine amidotransferase